MGMLIGVKLEVIHKGFMAVKIGPSVDDCVLSFRATSIINAITPGKGHALR